MSQQDLDGTLRTNETTGVIPQTRWNDTLPLRTWTRPSGNKADILTPLPGQIIRSDGTRMTNFNFTWTGTPATSQNKSRPIPNSWIFARAYAATPLVVTLSNIPFAHYDLYVHVGGSYDGQHRRLRLGTDAALNRFLQTATTRPTLFTGDPTGAEQLSEGRLCPVHSTKPMPPHN